MKNERGIIPIVVALGLAMAIGFGIVVGNCGFQKGRGLKCHGLTCGVQP